MNSRMFVHCVVRQRFSPVVDDHGNAVAAWAAPDEQLLSVWISQRSHADLAGSGGLGGRDGTIDVWVAYLPPTADVGASDRLVWDGYTFEVEGVPHPCYRPSGLDHFEATLRRVEG
jgi:head-tail adaptor